MDGHQQARDRPVASDVMARLATLGIAASAERAAAVGAQLDILDRHLTIMRAALAEIARDELP